MFQYSHPLLSSVTMQLRPEKAKKAIVSVFRLPLLWFLFSWFFIQVSWLVPTASDQEIFFRIFTALNKLSLKERPFAWMKCLTFHNGDERAHWANFWEEKHYSYLSHPAQYKKDIVGHTNHVKLFLCCWKPYSWVGRVAFDLDGVPLYAKDPWHTSVAVIHAVSGTRRVLYFNVDRKDSKIPRFQILPHPLHTFCKDMGLNNAELWVNKQHRRAYQDECLEWAVRQIETWIGYGDMMWQGDNDIRIADGTWDKITYK